MSTAERPKILLVHNAFRKFVEIDKDILQSEYLVTEYEVHVLNPFKIIFLVARHDLVFCWFAGWFSFLPILFAKCLGRPSIVMTGGYETVNLPEIHFGFQQGGWRKFISRFILRHATRLVTASRFSLEETIRNVPLDPNKIDFIYHGIDPDEYPFSIQKEPLVITVGNVDEENLQRKGLERFVLAAKYVPEARFVVVGKWVGPSIHKLKKIAPSNVSFTGHVSFEELLHFFERAKVYVQASVHEAFGMSLAEAMLCGCVPVVTRSAALPEVVGSSGFYADATSPENLANIIREALWADDSWNAKARERIEGEFPLTKRRRELISLVNSLIKKSL